MWQWTYPMAAIVLHIFTVGIYNFRTRKGAIVRGEMKAGFFRVFDGQTYPATEAVLRVGNHYNNQFELPMLFLVTGAVSIQLGIFSTLAGILAWLFVLSRLIHSYIHLGKNNVIARAQAFAVGWLCILGLWILILIKSMPVSYTVAL